MGEVFCGFSLLGLLGVRRLSSRELKKCSRSSSAGFEGFVKPTEAELNTSRLRSHAGAIHLEKKTGFRNRTGALSSLTVS